MSITWNPALPADGDERAAHTTGAIPAWREFSAAPNVGPHARYALYSFDQRPGP